MHPNKSMRQNGEHQRGGEQGKTDRCKGRLPGLHGIIQTKGRQKRHAQRKLLDSLAVVFKPLLQLRKLVHRTPTKIRVVIATTATGIRP